MPYKRFYPRRNDASARPGPAKQSRAPSPHRRKGGPSSSHRAPMRGEAPHVHAPEILPSTHHDGYLKFVPLGGCGEVTRSCYVYEYKDDIVIIDMGLQWPEEDMPGIDYLIPNVAYLKPKRKNIRGIIITHGHYDHIGAIPHLMEPLGYPPVYATALTRGLIMKRQEDFPNVGKPKIQVINTESRIKLGSFTAEFFHVNHNIPDSVGVFLQTPAGNVVHTGDWKFDHTPVNERPADVARLKEIGKKGALLLVSDSTDAEHEGHQISETEVQQSLEAVFQEAPGRILAATFASLLTRIQQMIWLSERYNRKVLILGSSMKANVAVSQELGYLKVKKGTFITEQDLNLYPDHRITILCTGAQGEDHAVLMRVANAEHRTVSLKPMDAVIFSSSVIPGNEATVQRLKDILYKKAGRIYHKATMDVHAGGHAKREELQQMIELVRPRYFIPIHGNYFMLRLHADLAVAGGVRREHVMIAEDGNIILMNKEHVKKAPESAPMDLVMVDGLGVGDIKEVVLRDRQHLAEDGIFVIIALVDSRTGKIRTSPDIISRGFIYLRENQQMLKEVRERIRTVVDKSIDGARPINWTHVKDNLREHIGQFLYNKTKRRPMVLPVVIEV